MIAWERTSRICLMGLYLICAGGANYLFDMGGLITGWIMALVFLPIAWFAVRPTKTGVT